MSRIKICSKFYCIFACRNLKRNILTVEINIHADCFFEFKFAGCSKVDCADWLISGWICERTRSIACAVAECKVKIETDVAIFSDVYAYKVGIVNSCDFDIFLRYAQFCFDTGKFSILKIVGSCAFKFDRKIYRQSWEESLEIGRLQSKSEVFGILVDYFQVIQQSACFLKNSIEVKTKKNFAVVIRLIEFSERSYGIHYRYVVAQEGLNLVVDCVRFFI